MNRIVVSPSGLGFDVAFPIDIDRLSLRSIYTTNEGTRDRQVSQHIFAFLTYCDK